MKIHFESKKVSKPNFLPKLKDGVEIFEIGKGEIFVGNLRKGLQLTDIPISLLRTFNGRKTLASICENTIVDEELIEKLIFLLVENELLDLQPTKLIFEDRHQTKQLNGANLNKVFDSELDFRDFELRIRSESANATWREKILDSGKSVISHRQSANIKILGDEEAATALYLSLIASGFTGAEIEINREVQLDDLRTGFIRKEDIGREFSIVIRELADKFALFNGEPHLAKQNLVLYFGKPTEKMIQEWLSTDLIHLVVQSIGPNLLIGPLVIPGKSPCLNCVSRVDTKVLKSLKEVSAFQKPAFGALNWLIGYLTLVIAEFVDSGRSPLIGSAKIFDVVNPNEIRDIKYPRHPTCGCNWL